MPVAPLLDGVLLLRRLLPWVEMLEARVRMGRKRRPMILWTERAKRPRLLLGPRSHALRAPRKAADDGKAGGEAKVPKKRAKKDKATKVNINVTDEPEAKEDADMKDETDEQ
jgi:hypothetical protein